MRLLLVLNEARAGEHVDVHEALGRLCAVKGFSRLASSSPVGRPST